MAEWSAHLNAMWEVSPSNPASYLCCKMHMGKVACCHAGRQEVGRSHTRGESHVTYVMPLPSANKAAYFGFETQRKHHQKSKTGLSVAPQKDAFQ